MINKFQETVFRIMAFILLSQLIQMGQVLLSDIHDYHSIWENLTNLLIGGTGLMLAYGMFNWDISLPVVTRALDKAIAKKELAESSKE